MRKILTFHVAVLAQSQTQVRSEKILIFQRGGYFWRRGRGRVREERVIGEESHGNKLAPLISIFISFLYYYPKLLLPKERINFLRSEEDRTKMKKKKKTSKRVYRKDIVTLTNFSLLPQLELMGASNQNK